MVRGISRILRLENVVVRIRRGLLLLVAIAYMSFACLTVAS